jgi:hypothetical protein
MKSIYSVPVKSIQREQRIEKNSNKCHEGNQNVEGLKFHCYVCLKLGWPYFKGFLVTAGLLRNEKMSQTQNVKHHCIRKKLGSPRKHLFWNSLLLMYYSLYIVVGKIRNKWNMRSGLFHDVVSILII